METNDLTHLLPSIRTMAFEHFGDMAVAEKIAQEAIGRGILAIAKGEIRDGLPADDFIVEIAHNIINNEILDREA